MGNVMVFDTETTSLEKPFCYNVGYVIMDTKTGMISVSRDYVIDQVWYNSPLFSTAYYAEKRKIYVSAMRGKRAKLRKWGHVMQRMMKDIETYNVTSAYAYNSPFDDKVFTFNNDWYRTINPFDTLPIFDIHGYAHQFICNTPEYQQYCEEHELFTDSGNYSSTAESIYRFITKQDSFNEEHTALADSMIEADILNECLERGAEIEKEYQVLRSITRPVQKPLLIKLNGQTAIEGTFESVYKREKQGLYNFKGFKAKGTEG